MDGLLRRQAGSTDETQGHRCISWSRSPVGCVLNENNRDDSGNTGEKGAITMNDKLL